MDKKYRSVNEPMKTNREMLAELEEDKKIKVKHNTYNPWGEASAAVEPTVLIPKEWLTKIEVKENEVLVIRFDPDVIDMNLEKLAKSLQETLKCKFVLLPVGIDITEVFSPPKENKPHPLY